MAAPAMKTLRVSLVDLSVAPAGPGSTISGEVWAKLSKQVRTVDGQIVVLAASRKAIDGTGIVNFSVPANNDAGIHADDRGFGIVVGWDLSARGPNGSITKIHNAGATVLVTSAALSIVAFSSLAPAVPADALVSYATDAGVDAKIAAGLATLQLAVEVDVASYATPQAAIAAAQALAVPAVVKFGRGTYTLAAPLTVTASDITLDLASAVLVPTHADRVITFTGTVGVRLSRVGVRGGRINCNNVAAGGVSFTYCNFPFVERTTIQNGLPQNGSGVGLDNCADALIRDVRTDIMGIGIGTDTSPRTTISDCKVTASKYGAITVYRGSADSTVTGCTVNGFNTSASSGGGGIHIYASDRCAVVGNAVDSGVVGGTEDSSGVRFRDSHDFTCTGNVITGLGGAGIVVITMSDLGTGGGLGAITGNTIRNVKSYAIGVVIGSTGNATTLFPMVITGNIISSVRTIAAQAGSGINVVAGADLAVIGSNYMEDLDGEGIVCGARATITGNIIRNCGKGALGSKAGIFVVAGTATVVGNFAYDDQAVKTMTYGLSIYIGAVVHAAANVWEGWSIAGVNNESSQTAQIGDLASSLVGFYGKAPVARPAVIATPTAPGAAYVQAEATAMKTAVDAIRTALTNLGITA